MALETELITLLLAQCPRAYPDLAPNNTALPYVTWQGLGGESLRMLDNTAGDKRNTLMQVSVWHKSRAQALALARTIEDAVCASAAFISRPEGEPISTIDPVTQASGCVQRFSIWSAR